MAVTTKKGTAAELIEQLIDEQQKQLKQQNADRQEKADRLLRETFGEQTDPSPRNQEIDRHLEEMLGRRSENEITAEIRTLVQRLRDLYIERRGALLVDDLTGDFAWCAICGMEAVNLTRESAVCRECREPPA